MPDPIPASPLTTEAIAGLYRLDEIEGWQLLLRHFELADDAFAFLVVLAPDDWGVAVVRERFARDIYSDPAALVRLRFEPDREPEALASALIGMKSTPTLRAVWIDADPADPDHLADRDEHWKRSLGVLNRYRNALQSQFHCPLVLAVPARIEPILREAAPDLWAVRSGVCRIESPEGVAVQLGCLASEELKMLRDEDEQAGDPVETLAQTEKLRAKPGRELLLARLLCRGGKQARQRFDWKLADALLSEAFQIESTIGGDPLLRWETAIELEKLYSDMSAIDRAEHYARIALQTAEDSFGPNSIQTSQSLNNLATVLRSRNHLTLAEEMLKRSLSIDEGVLGLWHPGVAVVLNNLADICRLTGRSSEAEALMRRALAIDEAAFGQQGIKVSVDLNNLANLLRATNRTSEAESLYRRALEIEDLQDGTVRPGAATILSNLGELLAGTNRLEEAETVLRRALSIYEMTLGRSHPMKAIVLNNLAEVLRSTGRLLDAEMLLRRALEIDESALGPLHPSVAIRLNNLGALLLARQQHEEAETLFRRSVAISSISRQKGNTSLFHAHFVENLSRVLSGQGKSDVEVARALKRIEKNAAKELGIPDETSQVQ